MTIFFHDSFWFYVSDYSCTTIRAHSHVYHVFVLFFSSFLSSIWINPVDWTSLQFSFSCNPASSDYFFFSSSLGGYGYDSTDMAAIEYRLKTLERFVNMLMLVSIHPLLPWLFSLVFVDKLSLFLLLFFISVTLTHRFYPYRLPRPYPCVPLVIDIIFATLDARMTIINTTKISEATHTHTHSYSTSIPLSLAQNTLTHFLFLSTKSRLHEEN